MVPRDPNLEPFGDRTLQRLPRRPSSQSTFNKSIITNCCKLYDFNAYPVCLGMAEGQAQERNQSRWMVVHYDHIPHRRHKYDNTKQMHSACTFMRAPISP